MNFAGKLTQHILQKNTFFTIKKLKSKFEPTV